MGKIVLRLDRMMVERKMSLNELAKRITAEKFEIGNWKFTKCAYEVKGE